MALTLLFNNIFNNNDYHNLLKDINIVITDLYIFRMLTSTIKNKMNNNNDYNKSKVITITDNIVNKHQ